MHFTFYFFFFVLASFTSDDIFQFFAGSVCCDIVLLFQRWSDCTGKTKVSNVFLQQSCTFKFVYGNAGLSKYRFNIYNSLSLICSRWAEKRVIDTSSMDDFLMLLFRFSIRSLCMLSIRLIDIQFHMIFVLFIFFCACVCVCWFCCCWSMFSVGKIIHTHTQTHTQSPS